MADRKVPQRRRPPLPDQLQQAGWELRKAVERVERLTKDDRYPRHKAETAAHLRAHLLHADGVIADLLADIGPPPRSQTEGLERLEGEDEGT